MNTDIEKFLRKAPQFTPPSGLKERLIEQIPASGAQNMSRKGTAVLTSGGWLRRWWPALAPGAISVACAMLITAQQGTIQDLKANIQTLSEAAATESTTQPDSATAATAEVSAEIEHEINRLKEVAARLKAEIAELQGLKSENLKLRAQIAAPPELGLTAEEAAAMAKAKEKAQSINCVNNLKQFGLAVRVWALDNNDSNPPNVLCMSNELSTPKILICPADTMRQVAPDWSSFTMANCSYEFLVPAEKDADREPQRVSARCPIHGHIGLCDGSVQGSVAKNHPDWLVEKDGKLYCTPPYQAEVRTVSPTSQQTPAASNNLSEEQLKQFQQRYGLPPNGAVPQ